MTLGLNGGPGAPEAAIGDAGLGNIESIQTNNPQGGPGEEPKQNETPADGVFEIPEEMREKDWAKNFEGKTGNDLKAEVFKVLDEKLSNVPVIPDNAEGYSFNDVLKDENGELQYEYPEEALQFFGDKFKELGLTKEQGQGILKQYTDFEIEQFEKYTDADALSKSVYELFNNDKAQKEKVEAVIKEFLPQEDQKFLQKTTPNQTIMMFYKLTKGLLDKYAFKEGTGAGNKGNGGIRMSQAERDAEYERIASEMEALARQPFPEPGKKERLQNELNNLFAQNMN